MSKIFAEIASITGKGAPKLKLPQALLWPVALSAEVWAKYGIGVKDPMLTRDSLKMSKAFMYFSHRKAEEKLGYRARPAREALMDAVDWYRENGWLS